MARKIKMKHVKDGIEFNGPVYKEGELVVAGTYNSIRLGDGITAGGNPVSAGTLVEAFQQVVTNASAGYTPGDMYGTGSPQEIEVIRILHGMMDLKNQR